MILTDTHTHLFSSEFDNQIDELISQAKEKSVSRFFLPNINSQTIPLVFNLTNKYPQNCFAMIGLHPCDVKENYKEELAIIENTLRNSKKETHKSERIYAIGEIGLDLYWDKTFVNNQIEAFVTQITRASELNLAVSMHTRNATQETIDILKQNAHLKNKGVFHCFGGTLEQAREIIDMGFYLGIGGVITFKNSGLGKIVKQIDLQHIVLETDAPYLAPVPHRGKRNDPAYLYLIAEKIAQIKNVSIEEVASITTENSKKIFGI